jgi:transcriptional regulator with XRE-family HTH domain
MNTGRIFTTMTDRSFEQRRALGEFVRAHREKLHPAATGLATDARRRTPGLRREEVAQRCGLSATWCTWIEQGRDVSVSATALAKLAGALELDRAERAYLFELASKRDPDHPPPDTLSLPSAVLDCVEAIASPAYILDRYWNARGFNATAERLFVGWLDRPGTRNLLRFIFLEPVARSLICAWEERARRVTAEFRAACSLYLDDTLLRLLIEDLRCRSPQFARFWDEQGVLGREGGERRFLHPTDGLLAYQQVTFNVAGHPDCKLTILTEGRSEPRSGRTAPVG